jgi:hypothetical protein
MALTRVSLTEIDPSGSANAQVVTSNTTSAYWGNTAVITVADSPPPSAKQGDFWWNSTNGNLKIYYTDADTSQWVDSMNKIGVNNSSNSFSSNIGFSQSITVANTAYVGNSTANAVVSANGITMSTTTGSVFMTVANTTVQSLNAGNTVISGTTKISQLVEKVYVDNLNQIGGTYNLDVLTSAIVYNTTQSASNWILNLRGDVNNTFNSCLDIGQSISVTLFVTQGTPSYRPTSLTIDGVSVTPRWQNGVTPLSGSNNAIDVYTYSVIKIANYTYVAMASTAKFA